MSLKIPGPLCLFLSHLPVDAGTLARVCTVKPGPAVQPRLAKAATKPSTKSNAALPAALGNLLLFITCEIDPKRLGAVDQIVTKIQANIDRYAKVELLSEVPWYVVAVIHSLEGSLNFNTHLHNGDPLTARTIHVPAGRPKTGKPPFTWEDSAVDALSQKNFNKDWSLPATLDKLEAYNGTGYRRYHPTVNTPYLWSGSNHYVAGKYIADGTFSATAVSQQIGGAVLLKRMMDTGVIPSFVVPAVPFDDQSIQYA